jgi:4-alpha-glucanotransferase
VSNPRLNHLAWLRGLGEAYHDYRGELRFFSTETRVGILDAMGCAVSDPEAVEGEISRLEAVQWRALLPTVAVTRQGHRSVCVGVPEDCLDRMLTWHLKLSDGSELGGEVRAGSLAEVNRHWLNGRCLTRRELVLPEPIPFGYHDLRAFLDTGDSGRCRLISTPTRCFETPEITEGARLWGLSMQLYTLRSADNWGIGDFADLASVIRHSAAFGAAFVGLNPLHALFPTDPAHCSPYSPSNRHFLNPLYISIPSIADFGACAEVQARMAEPAFAPELERLRAVATIDYAGVAELKLPLLRMLHTAFRRQHLLADTPRAREFFAYRDERGEPLRLHALHDAIAEHLSASGHRDTGWKSWPEHFQSPGNPEVLRFEARHALDVEFHSWLQWIADEQLAGAQRLAKSLGMSIGLYGDYAVSVNAGGSETWAEQDVYCLSAAVGAPPDALALMGQDWGIPPQDPQALKLRQYRPFQKLIAANMRRVGALRLDHVMAMFRQWWVPAGRGATEGGYVHYPLEELMSVLALESVSHRCLVVGEDLGTVPDEVRQAMQEFAVYHYKVLLFEKDPQGIFSAPGDYLRRSVATATTHDLPTLRGFWGGSDLELRDTLGLFPSDELRQRLYDERVRDRDQLLAALERTGLRPGQPATVDEPYSDELAHSVHLYLASSRSALVALQIEDLIGTADPVNVPGTSHEYPNWQRKLDLTVEEIFSRSATSNSLLEVDRLRKR